MLHIDTATLQLTAFELYSDDGDSQRRQLGYIRSFRQHVPGFGESPPEAHSFNIPAAAALWGASSSAYPQSPSTPTSYTGSCIDSSRTGHRPSIQCFWRSPGSYPLDEMAVGSPAFDTGPPEEPRHMPTIVDRFAALSPTSQRLFRTCGSVPSVQSAVLDILESPELQGRVAISSAMAEPLLEKISYTESTDGKGKRGAPQFYKCRWGTCGDKMSRKLHAVEHIMTHVDNRSHICDHCDKGFVRRNELKKHTPCKALKRKLKCIEREFVLPPPQMSPPGPATEVQETSTGQPFHSMSPGTCDSEEPTYSPAHSLGTSPAQFTSFNTKSSGIDTWQTPAAFQATGSFFYSQPVRVTTARQGLLLSWLFLPL